jgi:hypothetical protein
MCKTEVKECVVLKAAYYYHTSLNIFAEKYAKPQFYRLVDLFSD